MRHILLRYDIKLADKTASRSFAWRTTIVPQERATLLVRERPDLGRSE
jgi:hypothetical protein